jgi:glycosyltransferase involved in cell wall biosynthesis
MLESQVLSNPTYVTDQKSVNSSGNGHHAKPKISLVIPTLNEAENLPYVLPFIPDMVDEVLLVDGYSTDNTIEIARELYPDIRVVMQEGRGKGSALRTGFKAATGDIIVMLDADGSTDPREIPVYVGALLSGADFVKGSRFMQGAGTADMPFHRRFGNWSFVMMVRVLFGGKYTDLCYGYSAFWSRVVPMINLDGTGFEIETMMNIRALCTGLKVAEVPSFESPRVFGTGRLRTIPDGWRVLKTIFREYRHKDQWNKAQPPQKDVKSFSLVQWTGKAAIYMSMTALAVKIGTTTKIRKNDDL